MQAVNDNHVSEEAALQDESEEIKLEAQRGNAKTTKGPNRQNFMLVVGAAPGDGVKSDTKLIRDVQTKFMELYDKLTLTIEFP